MTLTSLVRPTTAGGARAAPTAATGHPLGEDPSPRPSPGTEAA